MTQFRKKPVVIEAEQFDGATLIRGVYREPSDDAKPFVVTIHEQRCYVVAGDWIIPEPDGIHFYPCKPDIFEATYEPASSSSSTESEIERKAKAFDFAVENGWPEGKGASGTDHDGQEQDEWWFEYCGKTYPEDLPVLEIIEHANASATSSSRTQEKKEERE